MPHIPKALTDSDEWVMGHIYALEDKTVRDLYGAYREAYDKILFRLDGLWASYVGKESWNAADANFRTRTELLLSQILREMDALAQRSMDNTMQAAIDGYKAALAGKGWAIDSVTHTGVSTLPLLPASAIRTQMLLPYEGNTFVDRFVLARAEFEGKIRQALVQSQIAGDGIYQVQKRIAENLGIAIGRRTKADRAANTAYFNRTEMIARTEILRASNMAALAVYRANKDVLRGWIWRTALDERVCPICAPLDGNLYPMGGKKAPPPAHPRCRCSPVPAIKDTELERAIVKERPTFREWAQERGLSQDAYGNAYDLPGREAPKKPQ